MKRTALLLLILVACLPSLLCAQPSRRDSISWSEFVEMFFDADDGDDDERATVRLSTYETLEELHASPLNINACSREELLLLPFLTPTKADSILAYRDKRAFISLGELLFVRPLTYSDRLFLPLFVYVGEKEQKTASLVEQLTCGRYEAETHLDVPLYTRQGNASHTRSELQRYPNRIYYGNGLHNATRFRYKYGRTWAYGLTLEKDAGEPFAAEGNVPYDYVSFFLHHRATNRRSEWLLGDYEVRIGQGMLFGGGFLLGKRMLATSSGQSGFYLKPHTSMEENAFLRGLAARVRFGKHIETAAFASWRTLDASYRGDTILTLQTSGLHRTKSEMSRKDVATALTLGTHGAYIYKYGEVGLTAFVTHFTNPVCPVWRAYNAYYFRGTTAGGFSLDYNLRNNRLDVRGEAAADHKLHFAYSGLVRYYASDALQLFLQHRHLSPQFVSLYGHSVQENSRCANEHGATLGATIQALSRVTLTSYVDAFFFPHAVYLNQRRTRGVEFYLQADVRRGENRTWQFVYRYKTKERGVTGYANLSQFVQTHRATLRLTITAPRFSLFPALTATWRVPQVSASSFGYMASLRTAYQPTAAVQIGAFAALFVSDDYQSALYAYEPQLPHYGGISSFYYHGMRLVATLRAKLLWGFDGGLRIGSTHYFNRNEISSGTQLIRSSWKNDISLQLRWCFKPKRKSFHT